MTTQAAAARALLAGTDLPARWAGRARFVVLDTGFGRGHAFLATWQAWQQDARRCDRLCYLAIEKHPPQRADLVCAHAHAHTNTHAQADPAAAGLAALARTLIGQWPPLAPGLHSLDFDGGRVRLLLALGDVAAVLPEWVARVDAFYLTGFAPAHGAGRPRAGPGNSSLSDTHPGDTLPWDSLQLRRLTRLAAPGATLATACLQSAVRDGLAAAGFCVSTAPGTATAPALTLARFAPRFQAAPPPGRRPLAAFSGWAGAAGGPPAGAVVAVIGAGLAGAAVARALAAQGVAVRVFDRQNSAAGETSGNAGGLFHGIVHGHDGAHARWLRSAALHTERLLRPLIGSGQVPGAIDGLLRGEQALDAAAMQQLVHRLGLPADFVQVRAGVRGGVRADVRADVPAGVRADVLGRAHGLAGGPAWFYPGGGWVAPAALCAHWLAAPGITRHFNTTVSGLSATPAGWRLIGAQGHGLADVAAVVLCNAADASRLLGQPGWPLQRVRGQTTELPASTPGLPALPLPLADNGYALRLADGRLLCGGSTGAEGGSVDADLADQNLEDADLADQNLVDADRADRYPADGRPTDDAFAALRAGDHQQHLAILRRLTGWAGAVDAATLQGRVGWRLQSDDRLPVLGPVPAAAGAAAGALPRVLPRQDQPRFVPRQPGLYVFTALGSRGITQAALGGELLACWITGAPMPVPSSLLDALDPARFAARAARRPAGTS